MNFNAAKLINNPLGEAANLVNQAKETVTNMIAAELPENYYEQQKMIVKGLKIKSPQDQLNIMNEFTLDVVETKQCSNQEPCRYFPTVQHIKFKHNTEKDFQIRFDDPGCCDSKIFGDFTGYQDIIGNDQHKQEKMYSISHDRPCCCAKWFGLYDPLPYGCIWFYCLNLCCPPKSEMRDIQNNNDLAYIIEYSAMSHDIVIKNTIGAIVWILKKRVYEGEWDLTDKNGQQVIGFRAKKYDSNGCSCEEQNNNHKNIEFPQGFQGSDKAAIIFAISKAI